LVRSKEGFLLGEVETKGLTVCLEKKVVLVDMVRLASKVEWLNVKVLGMVEWVEVTMEELVETGVRTSWLELRSELGSSFLS
jgi:hypothetical protein